MTIPINLVFEDDLSEYVLTKLLDSFGNKYHIGYSYKGNGFGYIKSKINGFNRACVAVPFLVLTDLDNWSCPPEILTAWFKGPVHKNMIFRVAIREVESWLLADLEGFSDFLGVSRANFPRLPEELPDPKKTLIDLAKKSRKRNIKEDIIPASENASTGPNYNGRLMQFVFEAWDVGRAMSRSESLRRAYQKLQSFSYSM